MTVENDFLAFAYGASANVVTQSAYLALTTLLQNGFTIGEAQSAESRNDFIHKLKVLLKELRESRSAMKIIKNAPLAEKMEMVDKGLQECNELISILAATVKTTKTKTT